VDIRRAEKHLLLRHNIMRMKRDVKMKHNARKVIYA
jgi:hypothetical protein